MIVIFWVVLEFMSILLLVNDSEFGLFVRVIFLFWSMYFFVSLRLLVFLDKDIVLKFLKEFLNCLCFFDIDFGVLLIFFVNFLRVYKELVLLLLKVFLFIECFCFIGFSFLI